MNHGTLNNHHQHRERKTQTVSKKAARSRMKLNIRLLSILLGAMFLFWAAVNLHILSSLSSLTGQQLDDASSSSMMTIKMMVQQHSEAAVKSSTSFASYNIVDFGAVGDNLTDNTVAFHTVTNLLKEQGGGEIIIPAGGIFKTAPFNLSSNLVMTVMGTIFSIPDLDKFPIVGPLPSYGRDADYNGKKRRLALVHAMDATNLTIRGNGTIDGGGWYWYPQFKAREAYDYVGRPHLMEIRNVTDLVIQDVTLKDSAFWTLHPIYCKNVHIHHINITAPSCRNYDCPNTDGIDIDSCENVLVEKNYISVGDDHVTILAGKLRPRNGEIRSPVCRNITVRDNILEKGMGLAIGSSTAGGVEDVLYQNNIMRAEVKKQLTHGIHIKTRDRYGGYVRNIRYIDNVFYSAGKPGGGIVFTSDYQRITGKPCTSETCTEIRDILVRNATFYDSNPGHLKCYGQRPCVNITFEDVHFKDRNAKISCENIASGRVSGTTPENLFDPESCADLYSSNGSS